MKIAIGSDHAGFHRKKELLRYLIQLRHHVVDMGCFSEESCDYPDYAEKVARSVSRHTVERGLLLCGTGIGMAIAANKLERVRAAVCWNVPSAVLASEHNRSNVLCLSARLLSLSQEKKIVKAWLNTDFAGGRHLRRIRKIAKIERKT